MDTRLIIFLIWCACNQKQMMVGLAILYEENIPPSDALHNKSNSQMVSSSDTEERVDSLNSPKQTKKENENVIRNARSNINKENIDGDEYTSMDYSEAGLPVNEFLLAPQNDESSKHELKDEVLNDSPMNKYGGSYPYSAPLRRQSPEKLMYTRDITLKQGRVRGIIRNMHPQTGLRDVDQFLGLPYAEAPVGSRRFMPPGTPLSWQKLKIARHLPPVCPQRKPDMTNSNAKLSKGRYQQLIRLLPYLETENEDCLYLNVYVPHSDGPEQTHNYPVIVYIHGESFEWNSGNPYDGSVLASYGQVIIVTLNYRLGILGFMKPGIHDDTVSNFGLLDQIAALHWIKENIGAFGGDMNSVTLMGHSTGAACVNFLMMSPVASGLFHRAILMSGSAMSDWAVSNSSLQITMQIAHGLNCPINNGVEELLSCLRSKRYEDIQQTVQSSTQFYTVLGPIVDGLVIRNQPYKDMSQYTELFSRYDLLFGVTELESYHSLNAPQLEDGMSENERDNLLRLYMQSRFNIRPDLALAATVKKYTDMYNNPVKGSSLEHRDVILDILSDARVVGPLIQTGLFHADVNPRNYMYVFGHNSMAGPHSSLPHSIAGEELAFVFGAPLAPAGPFHIKYNAQEKLLSEAVMSYWTNFAKTGNPKAPWKGTFINLHALEWDRYDLDWPEFNKKNQCFINIGIPPSIGYKYRQVYMSYWNKELPDELNQIGTIQQHPYINHFFNGPTQGPRGGTSIYPTEIITGQISKFPHNHKNHLSTDDPQKAIRQLLQKTHPSTLKKDSVDNMYNAQPTFGIIHHDSSEDVRKTTTGLPITTEPGDYKEVVKSDSTMQFLIGLIAIVIILNVIIYSAFILQKKKKTTIMNRKFGILSYDGTTDDELKRTKNNDGDESYVLDLVRKSNTYEAVKPTHSPINGFKITRQLSSSTVDADTKVSEWISRESNTKLSQKGPRKAPSPTFSTRSKQFLKKGRKVSVAIDATPQARSNSVLRQEPIEVTKQRSDQSRNLIICQEVDIETDLITEDSIDSSCFNSSHSSASPLQQTSSDGTSSAEQHGLRIDHKYSRSDPVEMYYTVHSNDEKSTSFINEDINVTCRDPSTEKYPLTPDEQIHAIKRRNFPKVLPNYPCDSFGNKTGMSTASNSVSEAGDRTSCSFKRKSLPPNSFMPNQLSKLPPMPPPRTISTLGRKPPSLQRQSKSMTTSPVMLAQDCPEEEEPEITQNTLIVGPIVPKSLESNYSTIGKKRKPGDMGLDFNKAHGHISSSAPVTPSSFDNPDPFVLNKQKDTYPSSIREQCKPSSSSANPVCSTFQPLPPAHHTEATYRIQPHVTDLTPLIIERSMQMKSAAAGKSNIPRMHNTAGAISPPSIPAMKSCGGTPCGSCSSFSGSTSRIPMLKSPLGSVNQTQSQVSGKQETSAGNKCAMAKSKSSSASTSSVSSSASTSNSSEDTTNSSTGTVRTELKQH